MAYSLRKASTGSSREAPSAGKNVAKAATKPAIKPGERLCLDTSRVRTITFSGRKFWLIVVDEVTQYAWSFLLKRKSQMAPVCVHLFRKLIGRKLGTVKYV